MSLLVTFVFLFAANSLFAADSSSRRHISYRTQLGQDLDDDHKPETATIRQIGPLYQVSIHFTSGRPKVHLTTRISQGVAGLTFQTADVNNDNKRDLLIVSATSVRPIAVWLNQGRARFKRTNADFFPGGYTGSAYHAKSNTQPQPAGNLSVDPLPQATPTEKYVTVNNAAATLLCSRQLLRPLDSLLRQEPPRGPPPASVA
jgi:hypothetical protein